MLEEAYDKLKEEGKIEYQSYNTKFQEINVYKKSMVEENVTGQDTWEYYELSNVLKKIRQLGYDGISMQERGQENFVVFKPEAN